MLRALSSNGSLLARACGPTGAPGHDRNMCVQIVRMKQSIEEEKMGTEASCSEDGGEQVRVRVQMRVRRQGWAHACSFGQD